MFFCAMTHLILTVYEVSFYSQTRKLKPYVVEPGFELQYMVELVSLALEPVFLTKILCCHSFLGNPSPTKRQSPKVIQALTVQRLCNVSLYGHLFLPDWGAVLLHRIPTMGVKTVCYHCAHHFPTF